MNFPSKQASEIVARRLIIRRSGTYKNQFHRGYTADFTVGDVNSFADRILDNGVMKVTPQFIGQLGGNFVNLNPSVSSVNPIEIPNQWNNARGIFILELEVMFRTGGSTRYFVQGFTDHDGFTNNNVDPALRMYINTVVMASPVTISTHQGTSTGLNLLNSYHLAGNFSAPTGFAPPVRATTRPQDVFTYIANQELSHNDVVVSDFSGVSDRKTNLVSSRRSNNLPASYLTTVFNGHSEAMNATSVGDATQGTVAEKAIQLVLESDAANDEFLRKLREDNNLTRGRNYFTYGELCRVSPGVDQIKDLRAMSTFSSLSQEGDSNHFQGQTLSTQVAVQLSAAVPSLMLECMLSTIHINVTNQTGVGMVMAPVHDQAISSFSPEHTVNHYRNFQSRALTELFNPITRGNQIPFNATIRCSYHSEFVITIKIGADPETRFVTPTFADSLLSPVTSATPGELSDLSRSLGMVCDSITEAVNINSNRKDRIVSSAILGAAPSGAYQQASLQGNAMMMPPTVTGAQPVIQSPPSFGSGPSANSM